MKNYFLYFCLLAILVTLLSFHRQTIILNEVVACNNETLYDNTGTFHDYIELYNPSTDSIDISGYHLSDSKKNLQKFTFPAGSVIGAKQYYVVWAGYRPEIRVTDNTFPYTQFAIRNGERIYLSNEKGKIIDKVKIPKKLECDVSYARIPYVYKWAMRKPSPEKQNPLSAAKKINILSDVQVSFSVKSGFYEEPFVLEMSAPEGFDIYYTLDSSNPSEKSLKYEYPLTITDASSNQNKYSMIGSISVYADRYSPPDFMIDKSTVVRAIAIRKKDKAVSQINTATYFVGFQNKTGYDDIPVLSIITDPKNLFDYEKGIYITGKIWDMNKNIINEKIYRGYANYAVDNSEFERDAVFEYTNRGKTVSTSGKIKIHGFSTRKESQKSFTVKNFIPKKDFLFSQNFYITGMTYLSGFGRIGEMMIHKLTADRNLISRDIIPVILFLDGEYWGLYFAYETINPEFIQKKLNSVSAESIDFLKNDKCFNNCTQLSGKEKPEEFNINSLIDFVSINVYTSNIDICNLNKWNLVRWRDPKSTQEQYRKWNWILYDVDSQGTRPQYNQFEKKPSCGLLFDDKILPSLLSQPEYRKQFIITLQDIGNYNFNPKRVKDLFFTIYHKYYAAAVYSFLRFNINRLDYLYRIKDVVSFYEQRFDYIMPHMKKYFKLTGDLVMVHKVPSKINGGIITLNTLNLASKEEFTGKYYSDYNISLNASPFTGYTFAGWLIDDKLVKTQKLELELSQPHTIEAVWNKIE